MKKKRLPKRSEGTGTKKKFSKKRPRPPTAFGKVEICRRVANKDSGVVTFNKKNKKLEKESKKVEARLQNHATSRSKSFGHISMERPGVNA